MIVPHDDGKSHTVSVSSAVVRLAVGVSVVIAAFMLSAGLRVATHSVDLARSEQLQRQNEALAQEITRLDDRVGDLSDTLAVISLRDQQVRLVAGLEPLDPDVRRAGIGGPAGTWPERERLISEGGAEGRQALRVATNLDGLIRRANLISASFREASDSLSSHVRRLAATPSIMPTEGFLTSNFSRVRYHPILHYNRAHEGIDITANHGTPIVAPAAGRVRKAGWENGYGMTVEIDHGYGVVTRYAHQSRTAVAVGQQVKRGERIGYVGSTGLSTGPHLHYEVIVNGRPTDPLRFIMPDVIAD